MIVSIMLIVDSIGYVPHLGGRAVGELHVGEVSLGALDVLGGGHQVVAGDHGDTVPGH